MHASQMPETMNSFDLDDACREACHRARSRVVLAPLPAYEPIRKDFDAPIWFMAAWLVLAIGLLAWRMPEVMAVLA